MPGSGGGAVATGGSDTSPAEATGGAPGAGGTTTGGASGAGADDGNAGGSAGGSTGAAGAATGGAGTGGSGTGGANLGGAGAGGRGTGGANTGGAATGGAATGGAPVDPARYGFENDTQAWTSSPGSAAFTKIASDSSRSYAGRASLAATINATAAANYELLVKTEPPIPPGTTVTARVYVPAGAAIDWLQIYVQEGAPGHVWTGFGRGSAPGSWATISVTAPASGAPIATIGIQTPVTRAWSGTIYVDSVTW